MSVRKALALQSGFSQTLRKRKGKRHASDKPEESGSYHLSGA